MYPLASKESPINFLPSYNDEVSELSLHKYLPSIPHITTRDKKKTKELLRDLKAVGFREYFTHRSRKKWLAFALISQ
jgi:hypothetical protein